jgi:hypothetical protein
VYQFSVGPVGGTSQIVRDFSQTNSFAWNPMQEGGYDIRVTVKNSFAASSGESTDAIYTAKSRVTGGVAVISPTSNPLVALYSAPPSAGSSMTVEFSQLGPDLSWQSSGPLPIVPGKSTNFLVAGMLPKSTYLMRHVLNDGTTSAPLTFTTGSLPTNVTFPTFTQVQVPSPANDPTQDMIFHIGINDPTGTVNTLATDLQGRVDWYYDPVANNFKSYAPNIVPGGTVLLMGGNLTLTSGATILREIDLAGDPLRETNTDAINAELAAMGQPAITDMSHEAQRLPNGDTAVLAYTPRTIDVNGTPTQYIGDMVIVLNQNFQVAWVWDPFKSSLSTSRLGTDGEGPSDWLHANSIAWSPEDQDLIVSLRSQDWVIKIDYDNGAGDGHVVWRLGQGGNFTINSSDPYPWFTHQHDVRYVNDSTIVVFDDGNLRHDTTQFKDSRGQELILNEQTMQATLVVNADLGNYSLAVGSAQRLPSGNLDFTSGFLGGASFGQSIEVLPNGTKTDVMQMTGLVYRSYFMSTLYGSPANLYDPGFEDPAQGTGTSAVQLDPSGTAWKFSGTAGVAGNGSNITAGNSLAPQGTQVAFLQGTGTVSQAVDFYPQAGAYQISLSIAQGSSNGSTKEGVRVLVDGNVVGTFTPAGTSYATFTTAAFNVAAGNHTISFVGVAPAGANGTALLDRVSIDSLSPPAPSNPSFVDLSSAFNRTGIVADGASFGGGGLDQDGNALSSSLVGSTLTTVDATFNLGPAGAKDVVSAAGQTIALSPGNDAALKLLATGVNSTFTGLANQVFVVTYTDGTTATFTQSISDWAAPQGFAGEATALTTTYRNTSAGGLQSRTFRVYEYTLALDPTKMVKSLTLPSNANLEVLAAALVPAGTTQVNISSAFNRTGIVADGASFGGGGLDQFGTALSSSLVGRTVTTVDATFNLGPAGASDVASATGQVIALPSGRDSALKLLATGVNGAQANEVFVVTYTDGTTAQFTQSISDWAIPKNYLGETTALTTGYRDKSDGTEQGGRFNLYEYTLALDPTKAVKSLTLPGDNNVEVLAATLIPAETTRADLSSAFNRTGIVADGASFGGGGLDQDGFALSSSLVGTSLTAGGDSFDLGPSGANDVIGAAGQVIALPSGRDSALKLLATGVNSAQANQVFVVTYTDGTTAKFTQSISDWAKPQNYPGEATALTTAYRDTSTGGVQSGTFRVYEYAMALDPTKIVKSLTLPSDGNVEVLAVDVLP